jgi:hypothetical protein
MKQKEVKIIGLKINDNFGILQSCKIEFDKDNNLIAVKGEVGSGKTTLQKSLQLGTLGSESLKEDKNLYGKIDQEVQLMDGDLPVFVGCKSNEKKDLLYTIYTKDKEGKINKNPIIDGAEATPSKYLKSLQTSLTWRMEELTSENPTTQKKILLDLYKSDLEKVGVIYDKNHPDFVGSILDRIEKAEAERTKKDFFRKEIGGFSKHLKEIGIDTNLPETFPKKINIEELETKRNKLKFSLDNSISTFENEKDSKLQKIINESNEINLYLKNYNIDVQEENRKLKENFQEKNSSFEEKGTELQKVVNSILSLVNEGIISESLSDSIIKAIEEKNLLEAPPLVTYKKEIPFEAGKCIARNFEDLFVNEKLEKLKEIRIKYSEIDKLKFEEDNSEKEADLEKLNDQLSEAEKTNKICKAIDSFEEWKEADSEVKKLKNEYASKLKEIDTGVEGLQIDFEEIGEKMNIHLMYSGDYDPAYFSNPKKELRKLSSYSGTQKPMICLLIQNYLLSKKSKALRYLWIDNVPIDKKTRILLEEIASKLNLTIIINITGDFKKEGLINGEILMNGGEVFFNKK